MASVHWDFDRNFASVAASQRMETSCWICADAKQDIHSSHTYLVRKDRHRCKLGQHRTWSSVETVSFLGAGWSWRGDIVSSYSLGNVGTRRIQQAICYQDTNGAWHGRS